MAEREQVLGRELAGRTFVDPDRRNLERVGGAVHEDDARSFVPEAPVVPVVRAQVGDLARDEDHAVDVSFDQHVHVLRLAERGAGGVAEDRRVAGSGRAVLHRLRESGEDRIVELGHEQPDDAARSEARGT